MTLACREAYDGIIACADVAVAVSVATVVTRVPAVRPAARTTARRRAPTREDMKAPTPAGLAVGFGRKLARPPCRWLHPRRRADAPPDVAWFPGPVPGYGRTPPGQAGQGWRRPPPRTAGAASIYGSRGT